MWLLVEWNALKARNMGNERSKKTAPPRNNGNGNTSTMATFSAVTEFWLFQGSKEQRNYKAEFVGVKTREERIRDFAATLAANHPDANVINDDRVWEAA